MIDVLLPKMRTQRIGCAVSETSREVSLCARAMCQPLWETRGSPWGEDKNTPPSPHLAKTKRLSKTGNIKRHPITNQANDLIGKALNPKSPLCSPCMSSSGPLLKSFDLQLLKLCTGCLRERHSSFYLFKDSLRKASVPWFFLFQKKEEKEEK